jgi:hypothetical protein
MLQHPAKDVRVVADPSRYRKSRGFMGPSSPSIVREAPGPPKGS